MVKKKPKLDRFADLTWDDLVEWAGSRIVSRGKDYQSKGRVCEMAVTEEDDLVAWVDGSERYATKVEMDESGLPDSTCTCPYEFDCKHGVALVIEYLKRIENNLSIPKASLDDIRLEMLKDENWEDEPMHEKTAISETDRKKIDQFLIGKTKDQLIDLIHEIVQQHPDVAQDIADRQQLNSGLTKPLVTRLRREIKEIGDEPGWQNYWRDEGFTPDYSGIRRKLKTLLDSRHFDEVLPLGRELISTGIRQVDESHDNGETMMEVAACMPLIVNALEQSSLESADKLNWALDAELEDQYEVCEAFSKYLHGKHSKAAWHTLADRLLVRLKVMKPSRDLDDHRRNYKRDRLSDWIIHALDRAGRNEEAIPLCEIEAKKTGNYERLVSLLISARRHDDAERWIQEGIRVVKDKWPGTAAGLRDQLLEIRAQQKNWPAVAAIQAEEFVRQPSTQSFANCQKAAGKIKAWPEVREFLLQYLEKGKPPWKQKGWPLPGSGLDLPEPVGKNRFPMVSQLIEIAISEKIPDRVLYWFDRLPMKQYGWYGVDDDAIAAAVQTHAPDRAVAIWKNKAEQLIAQVKPKAYQQAGTYLRKAAKVMAGDSKKKEWDRYLLSLREHHARKIRLMEVLDSLDSIPIIKKSTDSSLETEDGCT